jgi:hypothetical protein
LFLSFLSFSLFLSLSLRFFRSLFHPSFLRLFFLSAMRQINKKLNIYYKFMQINGDRYQLSSLLQVPREPQNPPVRVMISAGVDCQASGEFVRCGVWQCWIL